MKREICFDSLIIKEKVERFSKSYYKAVFLKGNFRSHFLIFCDDELSKVNDYILTLLNQLFEFSKFGENRVIIKSYLVYADTDYISLMFKYNNDTIYLNFALSDCSLLTPNLVTRLRGLKIRQIKKHIRKIDNNLIADFDTVHLSSGALKILTKHKKTNEEICVKILQKT